MYPPLPDRFEWHMNDRRLLNWLILSLRQLYEESPSEKILIIFKRLQAVKAQGEALETLAREHELIEAFRMIDQLPHAQRTYLLDYLKKDFE